MKNDNSEKSQIDPLPLFEKQRDSYFVKTLTPWPTRLGLPLRFKFSVTGVLFPVLTFLCIAGGASPSIDSPWQSGMLHDHIVVLLTAPTAFVFSPLLAFSLVAMSMWCYEPGKMSLWWPVRLGLFSGVFLAAMFCILLLIPTGLLSQSAAIIVGPTLALFAWLVGFFVRKQFTIKFLLIVTAAFAVLLGLILASGVSVQEVFESLLAGGLFVIAAAPTLALITFLRASIAAADICDSHESNSREKYARQLILGWIVWVCGLLATWKIAMTVEAIEYANLPTTNPNCFVSSAAAHGHHKFVGSMRHGDDDPVNMQMKRLKLLEFALLVVFPGLHQLVRRIYNGVGPRVARVCRLNVWFADLAFVLLKPVEILACFVQRFFKIDQRVVDGIYVKAKSTKSIHE